MILCHINQTTLEETAPGVEAEFPYYCNLCNMREFEQYRGEYYPLHWHSDVEIFHMTSGELEYRIDGKITCFRENDVGFINANVLHMTMTHENCSCLEQEHIFQPSLIGGNPGSLISKKYVYPLTGNKAAKVIRFAAETEQAAQARELMNRAFGAYARKETGYELVIRDLMGKLWMLFFLHMPRQQNIQNQADDRRIKEMLLYLSEHFSEKLTLAGIAAAAHISTRECIRCFKRQTGMTPIDFLIDFRVGKACEMLRAGESSITEVGLLCGFSSPSHFGKTFKEKIGCSPSEYVKANPREK